MADNGATDGSPVSQLNAASLAVVQQRVSGIEQGMGAFEREVSARFSEITQEIRGLSAKFDERQRIPWPALSVVLAGLTAIGALAYWPLQTAQTRNDIVLTRIAETYATDKELSVQVNSDNDRFRRLEAELEDRGKLIPKVVFKDDLDKQLAQAADVRTAERNTTLSRLSALETLAEKARSEVVPRGEHEEHWHSQEARNVELQRQIDEVKRFETNLVPAAGYLRSLDERLRQMEIASRPK